MRLSMPLGIRDNTRMKILIVLTSHRELGETGRQTGFWLEELAAPYFVFKQAGAAITLASPQGGQPPLDPKSDDPAAQTEATRRFKSDPEAMAALSNTRVLSTVSERDFDAVFYPGGHGPLWDLAENGSSIALIEAFAASGKPVAAVCHGPAAFRHTRGIDGRPLVNAKRVTGFTDSEEEAVGLTAVVPFSVEEMLKTSGAAFEHGPDWHPYAVRDGCLITGQNPASSEQTAMLLVANLRAGSA